MEDLKLSVCDIGWSSKLRLKERRFHPKIGRTIEDVLRKATLAEASDVLEGDRLERTSGG